MKANSNIPLCCQTQWQAVLTGSVVNGTSVALVQCVTSSQGTVIFYTVPLTGSRKNGTAFPREDLVGGEIR